MRWSVEGTGKSDLTAWPVSGEVMGRAWVDGGRDAITGARRGLDERSVTSDGRAKTRLVAV